MKQLLITIFLLTSTSAFAFGNSTAIAGAAAGAASKSVSNATAKQGQIQGQQQHQGQYQGQISKQGISNVGNTVFTGRKNLRNAPSFGLPFMAPTAICQGTLAGGFSFWLGGAAGAGTYSIDLCMQMETIRVGVYMLQNATTEKDRTELQEANKEVYCMMKWAKNTKMCPQPTTEASASTGTEPVVAVVEGKTILSEVKEGPHVGPERTFNLFGLLD